MVRPKHTKKDRVQKQIVKELRELGGIICDTSNIGGEVLDLFVGLWGYWIPVELKSPGGKLTKAQEESIAKLDELKLPYIVAETTDEILSKWPEKR